MSESSVQLGSWATHRGALCRDEVLFVEQCARRRVPAAHIATMVNRPLADVSGIVKRLETARAFAAPPESSPSFPGPPLSPNVVLSLYRGLITLKPSSRSIIAQVAAEWEVSVEVLVGPRRCQSVSRPRQDAMFRLYETGRFSLPQIGRMFGNRDHTTILHSVRRHAKRLAEAAVSE